MSDPSQSESKDIQGRRLANAFQVHKNIQNTLDEQEKDRVTDKRFAVIGVVLLVIVIAVAIYLEISSETTILSF